MNDVMNNTGKNKDKKRSPWPYVIVGFLAVVVAVNMVFIYAAITTNDGLVDKDYYAKGILYNKTLEDEATLGWRITLNSMDKFKAESMNSVEISIIGKEGGKEGGKDELVLSGASVRAVLMRPATDRYDNEVLLKFDGAVYKGELYIPLTGFWDIKAIVEKDDNTVERIFRISV